MTDAIASHARQARRRRAFTGLLAVVTMVAVLNVARADDPIFPPGSRIGLVPPHGMVPSHNFEGFEDPQSNSAILITTLPAAAYDQMEKLAATDALKKQGINIDKREPMQFSGGKGFLVVATQTADNKERFHKWILVATLSDLTALITVQVPQDDAAYPDKVVRAALSTLAVRTNVPDAERLSLLPFTVGDLAGFHIDGVLPGRALMLIDPPADVDAAAPAAAAKDAATQNSAKEPGSSAKEPAAKDAGTTDSSKNAAAKDNQPAANAPNAAAPKAADEPTLNARFLIATAPGGPAEQSERGEFARLAFAGIQGIKDTHVTMAEPLRIGGQPGYETVADATDVQTGRAIKVLQWLRFGNGGYMQMIGIVRADVWPDEFKRLRTVRDSIEPK